MQQPETSDFAGISGNFVDSIDGGEDSANVVAFPGYGRDVGKGFVGCGEGGGEGRFGGVETEGVRPGEGAAACHGGGTGGGTGGE